MSPKRIAPILALALLLVMLACGAPPSEADSTDAPTQSETTGEPEADPVSTDDEPAPTTIPPTPTEVPLVQIGEFYLLPEGPPTPSDYFDAMQRKVDAGEWTYAEGLVNVLKIYAGELDPLGLFPQEPRDTGEMNRTVRLAQELLAEDGNDPAAAEIERLLALLIPDIDKLLQYAVPEPESAGTGSLHLASLSGAPLSGSALQSGSLCTDLWKDGFPPGSTATCFQYTAQEWGTGTGRVFYPSVWFPSDPRMAYAAAAADALAASANVFQGFGLVQSIDLVFSELEFGAKKDALGVAMGTMDDPVCKIVLFPIQMAAANVAGIDVMKQTVAHEAFHCFQAWNFTAAANYSPNAWWIEGSAEYFSNLVYPTVNDEWSRVDDFSLQSATKSLDQMVYENTVFFQYLGNSIGDAAIVEIMKSISGNSLAAFASYPNMPAIFQNFGQAFMDLEIADTGGGNLPVRPYIEGPFKKDVAGDTNFSTDTKPFMLRRYLVSFSTESLYAIVQKPTGTGMDTARPAFTRGSWGGFPGIINGGCDEQEYVYLMTTVEASGTYNVGFEITNEEDVKCDRCLLGHWQTDLPSFAEYLMYDQYEDEDLSYELNTITGSHDLTMTPTGFYESAYNDLLVDATMFFGDPGDSLFETAFLHLTTGRTIGRFWVSLTTGNLILVANQSDAAVSTSVNGGGGEPRPLVDELDVVGEGQPYQCDAQTLAIMTENIDGSPAVSLYNKVSEP